MEFFVGNDEIQMARRKNNVFNWKNAENDAPRYTRSRDVSLMYPGAFLEERSAYMIAPSILCANLPMYLRPCYSSRRYFCDDKYFPVPFLVNVARPPTIPLSFIWQKNSIKDLVYSHNHRNPPKHKTPSFLITRRIKNSPSINIHSALFHNQKKSSRYELSFHNEY